MATITKCLKWGVSLTVEPFTAIRTHSALLALYMDVFKIELFEKETGKAFPKFYTLGKGECDALRRQFCNKMQIAELNMPVFDFYERKGSFFEKCNALDEGFSVSGLFACLKAAADIICICWDNFGTIDRMSLRDFSRHFEDIWFPAADNIMVFPQDMSFMVMIRHDGAVYLAGFRTDCVW